MALLAVGFTSCEEDAVVTPGTDPVVVGQELVLGGGANCDGLAGAIADK